MPKKENNAKAFFKVIKKLPVIGGAIAAVLIIFFVGYYFFDKKYENKFFPNVSIGAQKVAGQTYLEALNEQDKIRDEFYSRGLVFQYQENKVTVPTTFVKDEAAGISVDILNIDTAATVDKAYALGRRYNRLASFFQRMKLLIVPAHSEIVYTLNQEALQNYLDNSFSKYENKAKNAQLTFDENNNIAVTEEKEGEAFVWEKVIAQIIGNIEKGKNETIYLNLETDKPKLKKSDTDALVEQTEELLTLAPVTLKWEDKTWEIDKSTLQNWLAFSAAGLTFNEENITAYLKEQIAIDIDQPVKEGKFSLNIKEDDSLEIKQFQQGEDGRELKIAKTIDQLKEKFIGEKNTEAELIVEIIKPKATPDNISDLGIKELLGTGETNFSGSPYNRILNIKKGAEILSGLLIAPGETFSLVTALGHIDGANGWLPELVIKENKTIPEFGGGLCQIGTTTFRAAMMTGLPIVERQNHSYIVSYYNYNGKPGVDATIYEPKPDMRFTNNTGHYILWRSRVEGSYLYFEFWGTSDGRKGYFTEPTNYNWVSAPAAQITEVDDLAPGEMVCSEKAHTGVSASFDYIIDWPDGRQDKQTFSSVYKALPQVCRKGKEKEESADNGSTNSNVNTNTSPSTNGNTNKKNKKQSN